MSDSLIAQVKRLAEAQEGSNYGTVDDSVFWNLCDRASFANLLAHLQAQQAVVDAAREFMAADWFIDSEPMTAKESAHVGKLRVDLDAALSRIAALNGEKK